MPTDPPRRITYPTWGGDVPAFIAHPSGGSGPGVLVVQEWWAPADTGRLAVGRLAAAGFVALAPDLYSHHGVAAATSEDVLPATPSVAQVTADLAGGLGHLENLENVTGHAAGVVGFCIGGDAALALAAQHTDRIGAVVPFYCVGGYDRSYLTAVKAPVLSHVGTEDSWCPPEEVALLTDALRSGGTEVEVLTYEGRGHEFAAPGSRLGGFDEAAAEQAWAATITFLGAHLD